MLGKKHVHFHHKPSSKNAKGRSAPVSTRLFESQIYSFGAPSLESFKSMKRLKLCKTDRLEEKGLNR